MHKGEFIGNLGADAVTKYTKSGTMLVEFRMGCKEPGKDRDGNERPTQWVKCTAWNGYAEVLDRLAQSGFLAKGRQVFVRGTVSTSAYTNKDGEPQASLECRVDDLQLLGRNPAAQED